MYSEMSEDWIFRSDKISAQRQSLLKQDILFSSIAQRIAAEITDVVFHPTIGNREAKNKKRAEFQFSVNTDTLDIFFNGPQGYRAQYYLDPGRGDECNRIVIDILKDTLVNAARRFPQKLMSIEQIEKSLKYNSAKIWIDEDYSTLNQTSRNPNDILALDIPRWVEAMNQVLAAWSDGQQPNPTAKSRALLGVQAPQGQHMKVLGAWLDHNDQEFMVISKIDRSQQIHDYGFS